MARRRVVSRRLRVANARVSLARSDRSRSSIVAAGSGGGIEVPRLEDFFLQVVPDFVVDVAEARGLVYVKDVPWARQRYFADAFDRPGNAGEDCDAVAERDGFDQVVRDKDDGAVRSPAISAAARPAG